MNLITCKKSRGGNSLEFRVKSEEVRVGGSSSSWRFGKRELGRGKRNSSFFNLHSSLSLILSIALLFGASSAWAADWTDAEGDTYTALKYIKGKATAQATGGGWFVLPIKPNGTDIVKMRFKLATTEWTQFLWCNRAGSSLAKYPKFGAYFSVAGYVQCQRNTGNTAGNTNPGTGECSIEVNYNTLKFYVNGTEQSSSLVSDPFDPPAANTMLFASNIQTSKSNTTNYQITDNIPASNVSNRGSYYLYDFQIYDSATNLTHNIVPAMRETDHVTGLYDTVTRTFYTKAKNSGDFDAEEWGTDRAGKKWTGAAGDGRMSTAENWENNEKPSAGDDIDFTIAVPFAPIVADIKDEKSGQDVTFGKIYLGTGDLPAFSGALCATGINDLERMTAYNTATDGFAFTFAALSAQDLIWNGEDTANWNATDKSWLCNGAPSAWYDHNNAVFNADGAKATLTEPAAPDALVFSQSATVAGSATLTVPTVSVAEGATATISAPTTGALEKTGAGTLTLGFSRDAATLVTEGTLVMSGATVSGLTLGTDDPTKPVVFDYGGQTLAAMPGSYLVNGSNVTLTNGVFRAGGSGVMQIRNDASGSAIPTVMTIARNATLSDTSDNEKLVVNAKESESAINIVGGTLHGENYGYIQHAGVTGTLRMDLTEGGTLSFAGPLYVLCGGLTPAQDTSPNFHLSLDHSTFKATKLYFGYDTKLFPAEPTGVVAATNSAVSITTVNIGRNSSDDYNAGFYTFDFENCTVTTTTFTVYHDRPLNNVRFNATRFVFGAESGSIIASDSGSNWFTVGDNGLTLDTQNFSATLNANLGGSGGLTKVGAGTLMVACNQASTASLTVNEGTLELLNSLSVARPISVASGAVLKFRGEATLASLALAADSTTDVAVVSPIELSDELMLPESGAAALTFNGGAFPVGLYRLFAYPGATADDGKKFALETNGEIATWSVVNGVLTLTVGNPANTWIGGATGSLSDESSWSLGTVPKSGETAVVSAGLSAELEVGAFFSPDVIIIPEGSADVTFSGDAALTGLKAITNLSSSVCTFEVPVAFADEIDVYQTGCYYLNSSGDSVEQAGGRVSFLSGVTGSSFAEGSARMLDGAYYLPATAVWRANEADAGLWGLRDATRSSLTIIGSSYEVPGTTDTSLLLIGANAAFTTGVVRTSNRLSYRVFGEYVVTNEVEITLTKGIAIAQRREGTYKFEKFTLRDNGTGYNFSIANSTGKASYKSVYIGAGGINVNGTAGTTTAILCGDTSSDSTHLYPWHSDYAINGKGGSTRDLIIFRATNLYTDDENGVARTVTLNGVADVRAALTVKGSGRFQVNSNGMNGEGDRIGDITVTDSATLAFASGADLGVGAVTVGANATMEVASGAHTFEGGLTLNDGATLAFNFTKRTIVPQIAIAAGKVLTVKGAVKVKIPVDSKWPTGGEKLLTTCGGFDSENVTVQLAAGAPKWVRGLSVNEDGNIVLDVKPMGTKVIVR